MATSESAMGEYSGPLASADITDFQRKVYALCTRIPKGRVATYGEFARQLFGKVGSQGPRAVGNALRRNPFAPEIPCHRVVTSDYQIGGYSGAVGLETELVKRKRARLLEEGVAFSEVQKGKKSVLLLDDPEKVLFTFS
jgi:methylated-DNA-[protein]-cysteine S-methyltransferase